MHNQIDKIGIKKMMIRLKKRLLPQSARVVVIALLSAALTACGGGGGAAGTTVGVGGGTTAGTTAKTGNGTIQLSLQDTSTGAVSNSVGSGPLTALATVTTDLGTVVPNQLVTFTLGSTIATLAPTSGTALTDATGVAKIGIQSAGASSGATEITASTTIGTAAVTAKRAFSVAPAATATAAAINFVSAAPTDKSIVIKGAGGNGRTEVALVTFRVVDSTNAGIANKVVDFVTQSTKAVTLVASSATTGPDGTVSVALNAGTEPTTVRVVATVTGTTISTLSDTVTVTTGQPVQQAFSLSQDIFYVEGLNVDSKEVKLTISIADIFGGAVADGTQVVFTTDSGAIVGTGGARCLTGAPVAGSGQCSVTWRSQAPRSTSGVATVIATSTSGGANLSTSRTIYYSGSEAMVYRIVPPSVVGENTRLTNGGPINLDFSASCAPQEISLEIVDALGNPMPEGAVISTVNSVSASATVTPSTVRYTGMRLGLRTRGTIHSAIVTPASCKIGAANTATGLLDISVKTPYGETFTRIALGIFAVP